MIVDRFYHLDGARELCIAVACDQRAALIPNIGPLAGRICRIVERIFQIVVTLAPHQTQISCPVRILRLTHILIVVRVLRRGRDVPIIVLILILISIVVVAVIVVVVVVVESTIVHLKANKILKMKHKSLNVLGLGLTCCVTSVR